MPSPTVIITGATGAIAGHAIKTFEEAGWRLGLIAHSEAGCTQLAESHPDAIIARADLDNEAVTRTAVDQIAEALGSIDALLNIAGGFDMSSVTETSMKQLEAQLDINLRTAFNATRAVLPHMLSAGHGFILGVGAGQAINGGALCSSYAASKAALIAWMKSLRAELAPHGIEAAVIYPMGAVDTPGNRQAMPDVAPDSWIDPAELAATMLHLASRNDRGHIRETRVYPPTPRINPT